MSDVGMAEEAAYSLYPETAFKTGLDQLHLGISTAPIFIASAAERKNPDAQRKIIDMYLKGEGVRAYNLRAAELVLAYDRENIRLIPILYRLLETEQNTPSFASTFTLASDGTPRREKITEVMKALEEIIKPARETPNPQTAELNTA